MLIFCLVYWSLFKRHRVDAGENMMMKCIYCLLWFQSKSLPMRNLPILTRSKAHMPPRIYVYRCDYMYGWIITIHQPWPLLNYLLHPYTVNENHDHSDIYYPKNHTELNLWLSYHIIYIYIIWIIWRSNCHSKRNGFAFHALAAALKPHIFHHVFAWQRSKKMLRLLRISP